MDKRIDNFFEKHRSTATYLLIFLAFVGAIFLSFLSHELWHWHDFHNFAGDDGYICILRINNDLSYKFGYYVYDKPNLTSITEINAYNEKAKTTERNASLVQYFFIALFFFLVWVALRRVIDEKNFETRYGRF